MDDAGVGGRIVAGVDGSDYSIQACRWAGRQARLTGAELHVVGAWNFTNTYGYVPVGDFDWRLHMDTMIDGVLKEALEPDERARVHKHLVQGPPARVLLDASDGAELLVVGSRGHGEFAGMLLGSVSQHVVTHARCPVVVVHDSR